MNTVALLNLLIILFVVQVIVNIFLVIDNHVKERKLKVQLYNEKMKYLEYLQLDD